MSYDPVAERVRAIIRTETRRAYLGEPEETKCFECGEVVDPDYAYSARDSHDRRGYLCASCNLDEEG